MSEVPLYPVEVILKDRPMSGLMAHISSNLRPSQLPVSHLNMLIRKYPGSEEPRPSETGTT